MSALGCENAFEIPLNPALNVLNVLLYGTGNFTCDVKVIAFRSADLFGRLAPAFFVACAIACPSFMSFGLLRRRTEWRRDAGTKNTKIKKASFSERQWPNEDGPFNLMSVGFLHSVLLAKTSRGCDPRIPIYSVHYSIPSEFLKLRDGVRSIGLWEPRLSLLHIQHLSTYSRFWFLKRPLTESNSRRHSVHH